MFINQRGFSMLEVLVTVVITSLGLLGMAGLQLTNINAATVASANTQVMISIDEIMGQMYANPQAAKLGEFNIAPDASNNVVSFSTALAPSGTPTVSELGVYNWFSHLNQVISGVKAGIHCDAITGICAIKIVLPIETAVGSGTNISRVVAFGL